MLRKRWILLLAVIVLVGLAANGCSNKSTKPNDTTTIENQNLNDPAGGFNTLGGQPGFGDQALAGSSSAEAAVADPLETADSQVAVWASLPDSVHVYAVTLLWGILRKDPAIRAQTGDPSQGIATDWSGHAAVNRGALVVRSAIALNVHDRVVLPRTNRRNVEWVSRTTDSFSGIRFWVYQPLPDGIDGSRDSLTIVAGTHTWTFLVNNLAGMDTTYVIGDSGNRFAIKTFRIERGACVRGFLNGIWLPPTTSGDNGLIRGRVLDDRGEVRGHIKGFFGTNNQGSNVFFAKYLDQNGAFKGIIRGTWIDRGSEVAESGLTASGKAGSFRGEVLDAAKNPVGAVHGHWHTRLNNTDGFFEGFWSLGCTN